MPALNFQERFAEAIISQAKTQTIRKPRKRPIEPGDTLRLYTGQRTKGCRLLATARCTEVAEAMIGGDRVSINNRLLLDVELAEFVRADGFDCSAEFFEFFAEQYGIEQRGGPRWIVMQLIKWEVLP